MYSRGYFKAGEMDENELPSVILDAFADETCTTSCRAQQSLAHLMDTALCLHVLVLKTV